MTKIDPKPAIRVLGPKMPTIRRYPLILGGLNNRYLPEELYDPKTGTSETAVLMEKAVGGPSGDTAVSIEDRPEEPSPRPVPARHVSKEIRPAVGIIESTGHVGQVLSGLVRKASSGVDAAQKLGHYLSRYTYTMYLSILLLP